MRFLSLALPLIALISCLSAEAAEREGLGANLSGGYLWGRTGGGNDDYPTRDVGASVVELAPGYAFDRFFLALDFHYNFVNPRGGQMPAGNLFAGNGWYGGLKGEVRQGPWVLGFGVHFLGHEDFTNAGLSFTSPRGADLSLGYQAFSHFPMTIDGFLDYSRFYHQTGAAADDISSNPLVVWGAGVGVTFRIGPHAMPNPRDYKTPEEIPDPVPSGKAEGPAVREVQPKNPAK